MKQHEAAQLAHQTHQGTLAGLGPTHPEGREAEGLPAELKARRKYQDIKKGRDPLRTFMPGTARRAP